MCIVDEKQTFPGFQNVNDYVSTEERVYTPIVDRIRALKLDDKIPCDDAFDLQDVDISEYLHFVASREATSSSDAKESFFEKSISDAVQCALFTISTPVVGVVVEAGFVAEASFLDKKD
jgi:hypothetical protein